MVHSEVSTILYDLGPVDGQPLQTPQSIQPQIEAPFPMMILAQQQPIISHLSQVPIAQIQNDSHFISNYPIYENDPRKGPRKNFFNNQPYNIIPNKQKGKLKVVDGTNEIMYEGEHINGKPEGYGHGIYKNGIHYIGQWKNGKPNGKGKDYDDSGTVIYEGDHVNGKREGYGKYEIKINNNDMYIISQFKNSQPVGKGKSMISNEYFKYEGDIFNGKFEGHGKMTIKNIDFINNFFLGNNLPNELLGLFDNLEYEGNFVNGKLEGLGKIIFKDGFFCTSQFKNNIPIGKGKYYAPNGDLIMTVDL